MKIAVMADSTSYIPQELREKHDIHIVPLSVVFEDGSYQEDIDITTEEFYEKLRESDELPTTSQPSVGAFVDLYKVLANDNYDAVITVHLSRKISGTYDVAQSAGEMVKGIEVYAYDSELSALAQGFFAIEAAKMAKKGDKTPDEIIARLDKLKEKMFAYFMVDDLTNLQRGGRLSGAQALVGSLLKIKPILHFEDGEIVPYEKIRTRKKAISRIMSLLEADIEKGSVEKVVFIHANDEASAVELEKEFSKKHSDIETTISYFGPVIGTHLGEGAIGVAWYHSF
ncbi:MAG TPA: DegV family protein [Bacillota bacterium]|nr:DegV family protein [Bacillota bacterium]